MSAAEDLLSDEDIESAEDVDTALGQLAGLCRDANQGDLAVAIEQLASVDLANEEEIEMGELPFYEDERETAFTVGLSVGVLMEKKDGYVGGAE